MAAPACASPRAIPKPMTPFPQVTKAMLPFRSKGSMSSPHQASWAAPSLAQQRSLRSWPISARPDLFGRLAQARCGRLHLGIDVDFELGEVLLEHVDQCTGLHVVAELVGPGLARIENGRLDALERDGDLEPKHGIGAHRLAFQGTRQGRNEEGTRDPDRHASADAELTARPARVHQPTIDIVTGNQS